MYNVIVKGSSHNFSIRSLLALFLVLGLAYLVLDFSSRFYYGPLCQRYGESRRLTYTSYTIGRVKWGHPAECFFRDANGNSKRVQASTIQLTPSDWVRWLLRWVATILGVGGSVWLASVVGGFKVSRRRR